VPEQPVPFRYWCPAALNKYRICYIHIVDTIYICDDWFGKVFVTLESWLIHTLRLTRFARFFVAKHTELVQNYTNWDFWNGNIPSGNPGVNAHLHGPTFIPMGELVLKKLRPVFYNMVWSQGRSLPLGVILAPRGELGPQGWTWPQEWTWPLAVNLAPGVNFVPWGNVHPFVHPRGKHSLLFRRMEGWTFNFIPRG
jgi:hypothetical protein